MDSVALSRLARRRIATREKILSEALALFARRGFESTTVDDIVARADVAKGTFFNYFPRKEALIEHLFEDRLRAAVAGAADLLSVAIPVRDKLLDLFCEAASGHESDAPLTRSIFAEEAARALSAASDEEYGRHWGLIVSELVQQGLRSGEIRAGANATQARTVLNAVYVAVLGAWAAAQPGTYDLRENMREHVLLVLDGIGA